MSWIILIIAGLFESGFAFCLGKMKGCSGMEYYLWGVSFIICLALSMLLLAKATQTLPIGISLSRVDRISVLRNRFTGNFLLSRTSHSAAFIFHTYPDGFNCRTENDVT